MECCLLRLKPFLWRKSFSYGAFSFDLRNCKNKKIEQEFVKLEKTWNGDMKVSTAFFILKIAGSSSSKLEIIVGLEWTLRRVSTRPLTWKILWKFTLCINNLILLEMTYRDLIEKLASVIKSLNLDSLLSIFEKRRIFKRAVATFSDALLKC